MTAHLSRGDARRILLRAQLLDADRPGDVVETAEQLTEIKLDPMATIAPAEHGILWSRIGRGYEPAQLSKAVERDRLLFEFDGSFRPIGLLPLMLPTMRRWPQREKTRAWLDANEKFKNDVLARIRSDGPLLASDIPDTAQVPQAPDGWSGSNQVPIMLDFLMRQGKVAVASREGRHKRWDLAERVYPDDLPEYELDEAQALLEERMLQSQGIAKPHYYWSGVGKQTGEAATVEGSTAKWRVDPAALATLDDDPGGRAAILHPYDRLFWDRKRISELFGFDYVHEHFKPLPQRRYGKFAHPILVGDRFVGMLDAEFDRERGVLRVNEIHELLPLEAEEHEMIRAEIDDLAGWLEAGVDGDVGEPE